MKISTDNLVWIDMEMTGLDVTSCVVLEVAMVITNTKLESIYQVSYVIHQSDEELQKMDSWNSSTHTKSGLVDRVKISEYTVAAVEKKLLSIVKEFVPVNASPLCGNTVHQDRLFLAKYMPKLHQFLHYRNLDVSSFKEVAKRWYPNIYQGFKKHNCHEALADICESIEEMKYYREHLLVNQDIILSK